MIPIFQTIVHKKKGTCLQAAIASLLEMPISKVPNFIAAKDWFHALYEFLTKNGLEFLGTAYNTRTSTCGEVFDNQLDRLRKYPGVKGIFMATVNSAVFPECTHAVLIDKDLNIVHDPNPSNKGRKNYPGHEQIGSNGIISAFIINHKT